MKAYSADRRLVYLNCITLDGEGNPVILVVTSSDHRPGPQGDPRRWEVLHHKDGPMERALRDHLDAQLRHGADLDRSGRDLANRRTNRAGPATLGRRW